MIDDVDAWKKAEYICVFLLFVIWMFGIINGIISIIGLF